MLGWRWDNPFVWNLGGAIAYVIFAILCVFSCVVPTPLQNPAAAPAPTGKKLSDPSAPKRRWADAIAGLRAGVLAYPERPHIRHRLVIVLVFLTYLGIGLAFASIYHDLLIDYVGRFNAFYWNHAVLSAAFRQDLLGLRSHDWWALFTEKDRKELAEKRQRAGDESAIPLFFRANRPRLDKLITVLRLRLYSVDALASARPEASAGQGGAENMEPFVDVSFHFLQNDWGLELPENKKTEVQLRGLDRDYQENVRLNEEARRRLEDNLKKLLGFAHPANQVHYSVSIIGAADETGLDQENQSLAKQRALAVKNLIQTLVDNYNGTQSWHIKAIRSSLNGIRTVDIATQFANGLAGLSLLSNDPDTQHRSLTVDDARRHYRTARLTIQDSRPIQPVRSRFVMCRRPMCPLPTWYIFHS